MQKILHGYKQQERSRKEICTQIGAGWHGLVNELIDVLFDLGWDGHVTQIKEKFGGLRFYIGVGSEEIFNIINEYEKLSYTICEECGMPGKLRYDVGMLVTLCDKHYNDVKKF